LILNGKSTVVFVSGKVADITIIIAVIVVCIAAVVIVIAVLFYCYKVNNRYRAFHEFQSNFVTVSILQQGAIRTLP